MKPALAVTVGDPAGVGAEVVLKAFADPVSATARLLAVGSLVALQQAKGFVPTAPALRTVNGVAEAKFEPGVVDVLAVGSNQPVALGRVSAAAGQIAYETVVAAADLALHGEVDGIVTAPINKESLRAAGHAYPGHTELLAEITEITDFAMMLTAGKLKVAHVTTHVGLRQVFALVTPERVHTTARLAHEALREMGVEAPRIGVAGLNPHAGEGGLFGDEEARLIVPAVQRARDDGMAVTGPWPPDTLFGRAVEGEFDVVVAMFHDQGHIAVKVLGFDSGVNATIGLPIVRTSVDHGTAFDIAGRGLARHQSMVEAIQLAAEMAGAKRAAAPR